MWTCHALQLTWLWGHPWSGFTPSAVLVHAEKHTACEMPTALWEKKNKLQCTESCPAQRLPPGNHQQAPRGGRQDHFSGGCCCRRSPCP